MHEKTYLNQNSQPDFLTLFSCFLFQKKIVQKNLLIWFLKWTNKNVEMLPTIAEHASGLPIQLNN